MKNSFFNQFTGLIKNGNVFASQDATHMNPADALASARKTRDAIVQGQPMTMDSRGTIHSKNDDNSLNRHNVSEIKGGNKFAIQWYENDKKLYEFEFNEMKKTFPQAELSVLKDDRLCWNITFDGILDSYGYEHSWSFMLIYDSDHPHDKYDGGSIKVYPIKPSVGEMITMAQNSGKGRVPHLRQDDFDNIILCTAPASQVQVNRHKAVSAITVATWTVSWATHFQQGLTDNSVWEKFKQD